MKTIKSKNKMLVDWINYVYSERHGCFSVAQLKLAQQMFDGQNNLKMITLAHGGSVTSGTSVSREHIKYMMESAEASENHGRSMYLLSAGEVPMRRIDETDDYTFSGIRYGPSFEPAEETCQRSIDIVKKRVEDHPNGLRFMSGDEVVWIATADDLQDTLELAEFRMSSAKKGGATGNTYGAPFHMPQAELITK